MGIQMTDKTLVQVPLSPKERIAVDDFRRRHKDLPSRPEAIRELFHIGLSKQRPVHDELAGTQHEHA
jgi:hypothetical protein